ncbi:hypothetical protein GCM10010531_14330 [Blastococcus jejuensis]|uniref:Uncharacterized protein n=1 Tax=Blastococcus jejuensis TaxID=351224 RepID=A0ABP6P0J0_9ACTN
MAGPSEHDPGEPSPGPGLADPTRDIRLPPLPGTTPPVLPTEWRGRAVPAAPEQEPEPGPGPVPADEPTDELGAPPTADRERTLTFSGSAAERWAAGHAATPDPAWSSVPPARGPVVAPRTRERSRRWPWIVLTLVPVLVIVVTGVWLLVLMQGG